MRRNWIVRGALIALLVVAITVGVTYALMSLWNWLIPPVIGWKSIDFWQALGLLILSRILFGFRGGWGRGRHWRGRMSERWHRMTPEEREKFREGMRARCGHRGEETPSA